MFILVGLAVLEYGCRNSRGNQSKVNVITGIDNSVLIEIDSNREELQEATDSVSFDRFKIQTEFIDEFVMELPSYNFSAYAIPAPPAELFLDLDSIKIRNIATEDSSDITSSFIMGVKDDEYRIELTNDSIFKENIRFVSRPYQLVYDLYMRDTVVSRANYKFEVDYYLPGGQVFTTTTKQILITP